MSQESLQPTGSGYLQGSLDSLTSWMQPGAGRPPPVSDNVPASTAAVQVNAEIRELYMKASRELREAQTRELRLQDELRQRDRELSVVRGQARAGGEDGLAREILQRDKEIERLRDLVRRGEEEHARALGDVAASLKVGEGGAQPGDLISNLENRLSWALGDGAAHVERQRLRSEVTRLEVRVGQLDLRAAGAEAARAGALEENARLAARLSETSGQLAAQSRELSRLGEQVRLLRADKARLSEEIRAGPQGSDGAPLAGGEAGVADLQERLVEKEFELAALRVQLQRVTEEAQAGGGADALGERLALREELQAARERNIFLETDLKVHSEQTQELREQLWKLKQDVGGGGGGGGELDGVRGTRMSGQAQSLQEFRRQQGY